MVQQEQGDWEAALEPAVQEIRAQHGEDEMAAASAVVDFYKERAKSLCQSIYNATGVAIDTVPITPHVLYAEFSKAGLIHDSWKEEK